MGGPESVSVSARTECDDYERVHKVSRKLRVLESTLIRPSSLTLEAEKSERVRSSISVSLGSLTLRMSTAQDLSQCSRAALQLDRSPSR